MGRIPAHIRARVLDKLVPPDHPYRLDPVLWIEEVLGETVVPYQARILRSVVNNPRTAVPACHGPGKSYIASRLIAWWLSVHPAGEAYVVWTAPRFPQVNKVIGRELRKLCKRHPDLGITCNMTPEVTVHGHEAGYGRKPADTDENGFQGIHARYVLAIGDEANGLVEAMMTGLDTITTGSDCRQLLLGNPDDPSSEFAKYCKPGSGWFVIRISALETPNFTREQVADYPAVQRLMEELGVPYWTEYVPDEVRSSLVEPEWVDRVLTKWGRNSMRFMSKVLAIFPPVSKDTLITPGMIECALRDPEDLTIPHLSGRARGAFGLDIARFGSDQTVIFRARGTALKGYVCGHVYTGAMTSGVETKRVARLHLDANPEVPMHLDAGNGGGFIHDDLIAEDYPTNAVDFGSKAHDEDAYFNRRAELYGRARDLFHAKLIELDPNDPETDILVTELQEHRFSFDLHGRLKVEPKDEIKKRLGHSPDYSDAFVLSLLDDQVDDEVEDEDVPADAYGEAGSSLADRQW